MFQKSKKQILPISRQNGANTHELILDAAHRQFSKLGFTKVTMEEIAADAGLGKATLYYYFSDKDELFYAVLLKEFKNFETVLRAIIMEKNSTALKLRKYVDERFLYFNRIFNLNAIEYKNSGNMKPVLTKMFAEFRQRELVLLNRIFLEGKKSGEFKLDSTLRISETFLHLMAGLRIRFIRQLSSPVIDSKEFAKLGKEITLVTEIFIRGIGICRKTSSSKHNHKNVHPVISR
ncbi:MAG: TetR/AcrR family transcriptional regulator [Bacteroidota bacterium]